MLSRAGGSIGIVWWFENNYTIQGYAIWHDSSQSPKSTTKAKVVLKVIMLPSEKLQRASYNSISFAAYI